MQMKQYISNFSRCLRLWWEVFILCEYSVWLCIQSQSLEGLEIHLAVSFFFVQILELVMPKTCVSFLILELSSVCEWCLSWFICNSCSLVCCHVLGMVGIQRGSTFHIVWSRYWLQEADKGMKPRNYKIEKTLGPKLAGQEVRAW